MIESPKAFIAKVATLATTLAQNLRKGGTKAVSKRFPDRGQTGHSEDYNALQIAALFLTQVRILCVA